MLVERFGKFYHIYKGVKIEKVKKHYLQGDEIFYKIENKIFDKLKEAKNYIDKTNGGKTAVFLFALSMFHGKQYDIFLSNKPRTESRRPAIVEY